MKKQGYRIGEVSRITGLSKDTLRYYDRIGLLKPRYVDEENGYRYYTWEQFWSIDIITCCRNLDVPIEKIREILQSNNEKVLSLLLAQREEARKKRDYFARIIEDIAWYEEQQAAIKVYRKQHDVMIRRLPERQVLYASNNEQKEAYHLKLQELTLRAAGELHSIRRNYGFVLDETGLSENRFIKKGEYIRFESEALDASRIEKRYLMTLPAGDYACFITEVVNVDANLGQADMKPLWEWLQEKELAATFVTADEIGLQLFEYLNYGYLCEIQVLLA